MKHGSTLIELLLYVCIIGIVLGSLVPAAWDIVGGGAKTAAQEEVASTARNIMERIKYKIRNAHDISAITANSINLINYSGANTVFDLVGGKVRITEGAGAINMNSDATLVIQLAFTNFSSIDGLSKNIQIQLTVTDNYGTVVRQEYHKTVQLQTSAELRGI